MPRESGAANPGVRDVGVAFRGAAL